MKLIPAHSASVIVASLIGTAACASVHVGAGDSTRHREELRVGEPVSEVSIETGSGSVELAATDAAQVDVVADIQGSKNHLRQELQGGKLRVFIDCVESPCGGNLKATLPASARLKAKTGSGNIALRGMRASTDLETGSGSISASDLAAPEVHARTGSGGIELRLVAPSQSVRARTGSGDVQLRVPSGSYRVDISTGSGDERVQGLTADAAAERSIEVDTGSGDVDIGGV